MHAFLLKQLKKDFSFNNEFDFNVLKEKENIESNFLNNKGIIQKLVINNNIIGYFVAIKINCNNLIEKYGNINNTNNFVFTYFQPSKNKISKQLIRAYSKRYAYIKGQRILNKIYSNNMNINNLKNNTFKTFFEKYFNNFEKDILKYVNCDYIINNVVNQSEEFDERLKRYYKNEVVLTFTN